MKEPSAEQIAWAAGWFEGEGSIPLTKGKPAAARINVTNSDLDVLETFAGLFGVGSIHPVPTLASHHKPRWIYCACGEDAMRVLDLLYPWLHDRRRARVDEVRRARARLLEPRRCLECGEEFVPANLVGRRPLYCSRHCGVRSATRRWRARKEQLA